MTVFVKPAPGMRVRAPSGQVIPEGGMHLEPDLYLRRRLRAGDLVEAEEVPEAPLGQASAEEPATPEPEKKKGRS